MCRYEVVSVSSRQCPWASDPATTHVWRRYTYHLCVDAADRGRRCDNAEATETQNDEVIGSTTLLDCRICVGLGNAAAARDAAIARAEAEYARAEAEAYSETRELRPHRDPEPSDKRRKGKSKPDKHREKESRSSGKHRSNKYHDDDRSNDGYDKSRGQERMH